jgi:hypothetical protein
MTATMPFTGFLLDERSSRKSELRNLHEDKRGAIMLMGLCMACFLIGSLWFLIGIGDAIVFRDQMQEAADHAVFTSAVLHAKGMNFISALNLIMLALVFFHILLGLVNDILFLACLIPFVDVVACPLFIDAHEIYVNYGNDIMKPAVTGLHYAEVVAAYGYPWIGALKGYTLGRDYGEFGPVKRDLKVIVLSPSMIPGTALDSVINKAFGENEALKRSTSTGGQGSGQKLGLPVEAHPNNDICAKIASQAVDTLLGFLDVPFLSKVKGALSKLIGAGIKFRYCNSLGFKGSYSDLTQGRPDVAGQLGQANDSIGKANDRINADNAKLPDGATKKANIPSIDMDVGGGGLAQLDPALDQWWGKDGPLYPWKGTANGSPWQEVWSMNIRPDYTDKQEHAVAIGQRKMGQTSTAEEAKAFAYFAEAEFYFDCKKKWDDEECNKEDNAAYSVQWRARLRRLEFPAIGSLIGGYIGNFIANLSGIEEFVRDAKFSAIGKALPLGAISKLVGPAIDAVFDKLKDKVTELGGKVGGLANPGGLTGSYH